MALAASWTLGNVTELRESPFGNQDTKGCGRRCSGSLFSGPLLENYSRHPLCFAQHVFVVAGRAVSNALD